jgi:hypothetical protein
MDPVYKTLTVGYKNTTETDVDTIVEQSRLVITLQRTAKLSTYLIQNKIKGIFESFFAPTRLTLGYTVDLVELTGLIKDVPGVENIFTQRLDTGDIVEGVSLVVWNPSYPKNDLTTTTKSFTLKDFQAIYFYDLNTIVDRIIVTSDTVQDTSVVNI